MRQGAADLMEEVRELQRQYKEMTAIQRKTWAGVKLKGKIDSLDAKILRMVRKTIKKHGI